MNNNFTIKELILYSFTALIIFIIANSLMMYYFLNNVKSLNEELANTVSVENSFLKAKLNTEKLLISTDLERAKKEWLDSLSKAKKQFSTMDNDKREKITDLLYVSDKEITGIRDILSNDLLSPQNLHAKSITELKGEMFISKNRNETYILLVELIKKIEYLIQYQGFILEEFEKLENLDSLYIGKKVNQTLISAIGFPLTVSILAVMLTLIIYRSVKSIEINMINTQNELNKKVIEIENAKLLFYNIINTVPVGIFWKDINSRYLGANRYFIQNTGFRDEDEIIGKSDFDMPWESEQAKRFIEDDKEILKSKKEKMSIEESLTIIKGKTIYLITSKVPLLNNRGEIIGVLGVYVDVTEQKRITKELSQKDKLLAQQSKMASMGEMLENIAHQWRQPLSVISTAASGLSMQKEYGILDDENFAEAIEKIYNSTMFLSKTIDDFRNYFKPDKTLTPVSVKVLVDKTLYLLHSKFKNRDINVVLDIPENLEVMVLENEFIQGLMNILNNANDALEKVEDKRFLFIRALEVDECTRGGQGKKCTDRCVSLCIKDNARGIPEDIIDRIFEPYFTTKHQAQGTGIGLYMTEEMIVKHMEGAISAQNIEYNYDGLDYKGAEFKIILPSKNNCS